MISQESEWSYFIKSAQLHEDWPMPGTFRPIASQKRGIAEMQPRNAALNLQVQDFGCRRGPGAVATPINE